MAIWKLEPTDTNSPDWEASTYRGKVIVRAASDIKARQIAAGAFVIGVKVRTGAEKLGDIPWNQPLLVSSVSLQDSDYPENGNQEIVGPPEALRHASGGPGIQPT